MTLFCCILANSLGFFWQVNHNLFSLSLCRANSVPRVLQGTTLGGLTGVLLGTRGERYYMVQGERGITWYKGHYKGLLWEVSMSIAELLECFCYKGTKHVTRDHSRIKG